MKHILIFIGTRPEAIPPSNDIDVYSQDIGFVSVVKNNSLHGFNIIIGGGLGMTHSDTRTYPRVGDDIGFCTPKQAIDVAWHLVAIQRDYGNRSDRKLSRFKYTVARLGAATIKAELDKRLGFALEPSVPVQWMHRGDYLGWHRRPDGKWDLTLFVENGRLAAETSLKNALSEAAALDCCSLLITPNQNIMLINIADSDRIRVEAVFSRRKLSIEDNTTLSGLRRNAMACVSMPTCPLAMAEAERYMPTLLTRLENEVTTLNLRQNDIIIRMTGCPNGCARPYLGEIGLVGKSPGRYNLYLGASYGGDRLSSLVGKNLNEEGIVAFLRPLLEKYANQRQDDERFGDFFSPYGSC
jgi:sulfite reductase (NADPH) hemoprotein beta-component